MKTYRVKVKHDNGTVNLTVTAPTRERAISQVMAAEKCPERAILAATPTGPRVVIKVEGGNAFVSSAPDDVDVVIIDYDIEGTPDKQLCHCHIDGANAPHIHR